MNGPLKLGLDQIRIDGGTQPRVLIDEQWSEWPQSQIAKTCRVTQEYVSRLKNREGSTIVRTSDGRTMNTSRIGRKQQPSPVRKKPLVGSEMNPIHQPRPGWPRTSLPHDPVCGARAIVSALGIDYAHRLIQTLTNYLQHQKAGDP